MWDYRFNDNLISMENHDEQAYFNHLMNHVMFIAHVTNYMNWFELNQSNNYISRVDFNIWGPTGPHSVGLGCKIAQ